MIQILGAGCKNAWKCMACTSRVCESTCFGRENGARQRAQQIDCVESVYEVLACGVVISVGTMRLQTETAGCIEVVYTRRK